jgi:hypothetical protein
MVRLCTSEQIQKKTGITLSTALNKTTGVRMFILDYKFKIKENIITFGSPYKIINK